LATEFPAVSTGLSADAIRVYGTIARQETVPAEDAHHIPVLAAWGLVTPAADHPGVHVALDPHTATQRLLVAELAEAERRVARMTALPGLANELGGHYARAQWRAGAGSEYLGDPATVNARLDDVVAGAREEILSGQPDGPRDRERLNRSVERDQAALKRGVELRTLYRDSVRDNAVTAEYAQIMSGLGASYRTLVGPYERCIVVDRRVAFISDYVGDSTTFAAWCVTDRAMVAWIAQVFDEAWRRANPWHGELRSKAAVQVLDGLPGAGAGIRTTPLHRAILRDMANGEAQRKTAGRLGISLRSLTAHIAELKDLFGAASLPELTYKWALSPDRLVDDSEANALPVAS